MKDYIGTCVGGPFDGRVHISHGGPFFKAVDWQRMAAPIPVAELSSTHATNEVVYVFEWLRAPATKEREGEDFGIWRPQNQSWAETLRALITGYHPAVPT